MYSYTDFKDDLNFTLQAEEEMNAAKIVYEGINNDLKEELPDLYERWWNIRICDTRGRK